MDEPSLLAEQFEASRTHLRSVAYRMLGSLSEADDAVQEAWIRLERSETSDVENLGGWLTTVVARVCLDVLRTRKSRREEPLDEELAETLAPDDDWSDPERQALLVDSIGPALLVVLETLAPAERIAFVLHDMFAVPFDEIAPIVGRSPAAVRQLASRARRRFPNAATTSYDGHPDKKQIVDAFFAASREGEFDALLALLDPDVMVRADSAAVAIGATPEVRGAVAAAKIFSGRAFAALLALIDGVAGAVWAPGGRPKVVFSFTIAHGKIVEIALLADPERLSQLQVTVIDPRTASGRRNLGYLAAPG